MKTAKIEIYRDRKKDWHLRVRERSRGLSGESEEVPSRRPVGPLCVSCERSVVSAMGKPNGRKPR